jgi:hypothetical protein
MSMKGSACSSSRAAWRSDGGDRLGTAVQPDQAAGEQGDGGQQPGAGGDALRVEVMGEQQKIAEHDDHQRVAPAAHLERFEAMKRTSMATPASLPRRVRNCQAMAAMLPMTSRASDQRGGSGRRCCHSQARQSSVPPTSSDSHHRQVRGVRPGGRQGNGEQPGYGAVFERSRGDPGRR